jgi:hypothetical protein
VWNWAVCVTLVTGEVCHPQHQEMRVRREVGTDEPIEVVEVEQNYDAAHVPKCVFTQSSCMCAAKVYTRGLKIDTV